MDPNQLLRRLPSVEAVLSQADVRPLLDRYPRPVVLGGIRRALDAKRRRLLEAPEQAQGQGERVGVSAEEVSDAIEAWTSPSLVPVINASGVVIHTNLGRAPLARSVAEYVAEVAASYSNLELNLATGQRGSRMEVIREILLELTGAEDALVVNNNAGAVYLGLRALASGREVIVSRGELVEIGGSFRIPDVMAASGARLVEVGTTNKTRIEDYRGSIGPDTGLLLKVHRSNFAVLGFTEEASLAELSVLARQSGVPLMMDMGSGTFLEQAACAWQACPDEGSRTGEDVHTVHRILREGVDLVCFSGDKMLGGPQSGILLGAQRLVQKLARDPMARALRVGKLTLAALGATLSMYRGGEQGARGLPVVGMLLTEAEELRRRTERLLGAIVEKGAEVEAEVWETSGQVGGGAMPLVDLPGHGVALKPRRGNVEDLAERLRTGRPPVLARRQHDRVVLDVRTVIDDEQLMRLAEAVGAACKHK